MVVVVVVGWRSLARERVWRRACEETVPGPPAFGAEGDGLLKMRG